MSVAAYGIWELLLGVRVTIELFKTKKVWKSDKYKQKTVVSLCDFLFYLKKETGNKVHLPNGKKKNCFHQFWAKHDKRIFIHFTYIESTHFKCGKRVPDFVKKTFYRIDKRSIYNTTLEAACMQERLQSSYHYTQIQVEVKWKVTVSHILVI